MYSETTNSILVTVKPFFLDDQSSPRENRFVWAYQVRIENKGPVTVQLRRRHWRITDSLGRTQEVRGDGVVGEQPVLQPGESFEYTSGTPLTTPSGEPVPVRKRTFAEPRNSVLATATWRHRLFCAPTPGGLVA